MTDHRHILLMGFKHVGKSTVGKLLATQLGLPFYELDDLTEASYAEDTGTLSTCREIMHRDGEIIFREYESAALRDVLKCPRGVVALGGGTPMFNVNQDLIRGQLAVHITTEPEVVRKRVLAAAWPQAAYFDRIWQERDPIYRQLAGVTLTTSDTPDATVAQIMGYLK